MFQTKITKEEVQNLPLRQFDGTVHLIDEPHQVEEAISSIKKEEVIGIDTETKPAFKKGVSYKTALIQIATSNAVYLFRLNKIGLPKGLAKLLNNRNIAKIGIAVIQDMKELRQQYFQFTANEVIDLNVLCGKMGFENIGAKNLSAMILGHNISKRQQTSNWETPTLTEAQIRYAATDAWICREIYLKLIQA